ILLTVKPFVVLVFSGLAGRCLVCPLRFIYSSSAKRPFDNFDEYIPCLPSSGLATWCTLLATLNSEYLSSHSIF
ncbi:TPA: hypothetical protein ACUEZK_004307, partial [Escherichia coli]